MVGQDVKDKDKASLKAHPSRSPMAHCWILLEDRICDHHRALEDTTRHPAEVHDDLEVVLWDIAVPREADEEHCGAHYELLVAQHETGFDMCC